MKWQRLWLALAAGTVAGLVANNAYADGYEPGFNHIDSCCWKWSGFYIGGQAGGGWAFVDWSNVTFTGEHVRNDSTGFVGGGQIGYNWQFHHVVLGVEGTLSAVNLSGDSTSIVDPAVSYTTGVNTLGTATLHVGWAVGQFQLYAKGGWAVVRDEVSGFKQSAPSDRFSFSSTRNGWTVGTGLDFMFRNGCSVGLEYSYVDLTSESFTGITALATPVTIRDVDTRLHLLTARINFY